MAESPVKSEISMSHEKRPRSRSTSPGPVAHKKSKIVHDSESDQADDGAPTPMDISPEPEVPAESRKIDRNMALTPEPEVNQPTKMMVTPKTGFTASNKLAVTPKDKIATANLLATPPQTEDVKKSKMAMLRRSESPLSGRRSASISQVPDSPSPMSAVPFSASGLASPNTSEGGEASVEPDAQLYGQCMFPKCTDPIDDKQKKRFAISHYFGRNKKETSKAKSFIREMCRKHYQKKIYHSNKGTEKWILHNRLIRLVFDNIDRHNEVPTWTIRPQKVLRDAIDWHYRQQAGEGDSAAAQTQQTGKDLPFPKDTQFIRNQRIRVAQDVIQKGIAGEGKSTDDCRDMLDRCCNLIKQKKHPPQLPLFEFIPTEWVKK